jgi:hypothetical protein
MAFTVKIRDAELAADAAAVAPLNESNQVDRAAAERIVQALRAKHGAKVVVSLDEASQSVTAKRLIMG